MKPVIPTPQKSKRRTKPTTRTDRKVIQFLAAVKAGCSELQAAAIIQTPRTTVRSWIDNDPKLAQEVVEAREWADGRVVKALHRLVLKGNVVACIWWTKARLGWKETREVELKAPRLEELIAGSYVDAAMESALTVSPAILDGQPAGHRTDS